MPNIPLGGTWLPKGGTWLPLGGTWLPLGGTQWSITWEMVSSAEID